MISASLAWTASTPGAMLKQVRPWCKSFDTNSKQSHSSVSFFLDSLLRRESRKKDTELERNSSIVLRIFVDWYELVQQASAKKLRAKRLSDRCNKLYVQMGL